VKVLDLFSGIGGFSLGLERAGMETIAFCEFDKHAQKVLQKHWPDVPIHDDVRTLDGKQYRGSVDVVCGGYPCQPFSAAGKRRGEDDDRHLWPEFLRIIKESKPSWALCENVAGHITMGLDSVLSDLEAEGYTCKTLVIPAVAVDAKHRRDRIWIVANSNEHGGGSYIGGSNNRRAKKRGEDLSEELGNSHARNIESSCKPLANANGIGSQWTPDKKGFGVRVESGCKWEAEPRVGRVVDGFPGRVDRIKRLGNAVVPQIPEAIGRAIMAYESSNNGL